MKIKSERLEVQHLVSWSRYHEALTHADQRLVGLLNFSCLGEQSCVLIFQGVPECFLGFDLLGYAY